LERIHLDLRDVLNLLVELEWLGQSEQADIVGDGGVVKVLVRDYLSDVTTLKISTFYNYEIYYFT
jgi:hypothetical protein